MQDEINILELLDLFYKKIKLIISVTLMFMVSSFVISVFLIPPTYTSSISLYVNNTATQSTQAVNINDINASLKLVNTYMVILNSDNFMQKVIEKNQLQLTVEQLRKKINMSVINNTEVLSIKVNDKDAQKAFKLAESISQIAPESIQEIITAGSVKLVDKAKVAKTKTSPNVMLNTIISTLIGFVLSLLTVVIIDIFDKTIKNEEDLLKNYSTPILGVIPDINIDFEDSGYSKYAEK